MKNKNEKLNSNRNSTLYLKREKVGNKDYNNLVLVTTLNNGKTVVLDVKLTFFNRKLKYMLECNLPSYESK